MTSLLFEGGGQKSLLGLDDDARVLHIAPPDADRPTQGEALGQVYSTVTGLIQKERQRAQEAGEWTGGEHQGAVRADRPARRAGRRHPEREL